MKHVTKSINWVQMGDALLLTNMWRGNGCPAVNLWSRISRASLRRSFHDSQLVKNLVYLLNIVSRHLELAPPESLAHTSAWKDGVGIATTGPVDQCACTCKTLVGRSSHINFRPRPDCRERVNFSFALENVCTLDGVTSCHCSPRRASLSHKRS